ncbi:hypothetical protein [Janthinobacterium agaricidamnosum]|uniref:Putative lipoprotein n=1 Tax=Janthinobacterium agaricidamnosum NBRC 102515 = DSM 9628 TaxID=1349767 RepID=W0V5B0_9BURK|nr:hypothetical protein [Janthinobacterium agaricidamnosum]CDG82805.1 putative lipoprotein [Janthinobacterium agaricidamnosum NBRC 102515 = DSM 9628]
MKSTHLHYLGLCLLTGGLLAGCTNLAPVRTFADQTKKMSGAFDPMLDATVNSCTEKIKRKKLIAGERYDPQEADNTARSSCASLDRNNKVMATLNDLLAQYADTLAALADDRLPNYQTEFDSLGASLGGIANSESGAPLFDGDKLGKVMSLTARLSSALTANLEKAGIRDLLNEEDSIKVITNGLKEYAQANYRASLNDEAGDIGKLRMRLDQLAVKEPLASNYAKSMLFIEEHQLGARAKIVDAYVASVDELQKTIAELRLKQNQPDDPGLKRQLANFSKAVDKLRKQAVFYNNVQ